MTVSLGAITMQADDPVALAGFRAALTGGTIAGTTGGSVFVAAREPDGFAMFFRPRVGPRPQTQDQHLDLTVPWTTRSAEVERALGLAAVHRWDVLDEVPWVQGRPSPTWEGEVS